MSEFTEAMRIKAAEENVPFPPATERPPDTRNLYCIRDAKSQNAGPPIVAENDGTAVRAIQAGLRQDLQSSLSQFPGDHILFRVGTWDPYTMDLEREPNGPVLVMTVADIKAIEDNG